MPKTASVEKQKKIKATRQGAILETATKSSGNAWSDFPLVWGGRTAGAAHLPANFDKLPYVLPSADCPSAERRRALHTYCEPVHCEASLHAERS
jgi:hypothetical protein